MEANGVRDFFDGLNRDYLAVHQKKEELYWAVYMAVSNDHVALAEAEREFKSFVSDSGRLAAVREGVEALETAGFAPGDEGGLLEGMRGWRSLFEANVIESPEGRAAMDRVIALEAELFAKRRGYALRHVDESGAEVDATLGSLATNIAANPSEGARESSFRALRGLETWVLDNGFLEIVKARNVLARSLGQPDFFEYKVRKTEGMTSARLFEILDAFERTTAAANARGLSGVAASFGKASLEPWNLRYVAQGDILREAEPYFPFEFALERWVESFRRMGVGFRGATLQLDLLEREGKYQNGFCHGPRPAFYDRGTWVPARVNFTSEGRPSQIGAGKRALDTLFHEGGHAAHFSNVAKNAPCFSQEYPPSSMAFAETQSMFCESVLGDADWLVRYARSKSGEIMPHELIRKRIESGQPFRAWGERMLLVPSVFERALYAMSDDELRPDKVLALARETETRILGIPSPRPILAVPHLLNQESAASYHGYLLASMAVYQTRARFQGEYGYIADNPAVGGLLEENYWGPGNSVSLVDAVKGMTRAGFSPRYLAEACNARAEEAWEVAETSIVASLEREYPEDYPENLDAEIRIVHGDETIADNSTSEAKMCADFAAWVRAKYARPGE
jgi:oligoendopeptidase F